MRSALLRGGERRCRPAPGMVRSPPHLSLSGSGQELPVNLAGQPLPPWKGSRDITRKGLLSAVCILQGPWHALSRGAWGCSSPPPFPFFHFRGAGGRGRAEAQRTESLAETARAASSFTNLQPAYGSPLSKTPPRFLGPVKPESEQTLPFAPLSPPGLQFCVSPSITPSPLQPDPSLLPSLQTWQPGSLRTFALAAIPPEPS